MGSKEPSRFARISTLGEGSIGIVYAVYDRKRQMKVALKTLRHLDRAALARLQQEFRAVRRLSHPNIVTLYELIQDGKAWCITMELVEGQDIIAHVRTDGLTGESIIQADSPDGQPHFDNVVDESRLRRALIQLAQGLHAIHLAGLIHRDLKPSNVRVTDLGRVVVMDFSIVAEARNARDHSSSGAIIIGTPWYMAPEQATGDPPSPAIDWYGLGVILYQAITGRVPFDGQWDEILLDKQQLDAGPPSQHTRGVPPDLDQLCVELLARRPQDRPTGDEVLRRLGVASDDDGNVIHGEGGVSFVGRDAELAELSRAFERASEGECVGVLVQGPLGIGKSRLLSRFTARLPETSKEPAIVLSGGCHPSDSLAYKAFDGIMDGLSRALLELPKERMAAVLPEDVSVLMAAFPVLGRVPDIQLAPAAKPSAPRDFRIRASEVLRQLLANLAAWRSVVLCIDDLQWADRDSLGLLEDLLTSRPPARTLILASLRTDPPQRREVSGVFTRPHADTSFLQATVSRLRARGRLQRLDLGPLGKDAQSAFLAQLTGKDGAGRGEGEPLGTPLLVAERALFHNEKEGPGDRAAVSDLGEIFRRRIERLPEGARTLLEIIAVAAEPAPLSILSDAADQSEAKLEKASKTLRAVHLIRIDRPGREPWLTTYHEAVREVVLFALPTRRVRDLHQRLAVSLHRSGVATPDLLAYHWHRSGDSENAIDQLIRAAKSAGDRLAFARAAALYKSACLASADDEARRHELLRSLANTLALAGSGREAAQAFEQAADGAAAVDDAAFLQCRAADNLLAVGDIPAASDRIAAVIGALDIPVAPARRRGRLASQSPLTRLSLRGWRDKLRGESEIPARDLQRLDALYATVLRSSLLDFGGSVGLQAEHLSRALRHGERRRVCRALAVELAFLAARGGRHLERAQSLSVDVVSEAESIGAPRVLGVARLGLAAVHFLSGRFRVACDEALDSARVLAQEPVETHWERMVARYLRCLARLSCGDLDAAAADIERALGEARRFGDRYLHTAFATRPNLWRLMRENRVEEGLSILGETAAMWPRDGVFSVHYSIAIAESMGYAYLGKHKAARSSLERCVALAHQLQLTQLPWLEAEHYGISGRVAIMENNRDKASKAARNIARMRWPAVQGQADLLNAALAHGAGQVERAEKLLEEAISRFDDVGSVHFGMSAKFRLGQIVGPAIGKPMIAEATAWCKQQGVVDAERMFDYLSPWL